MAKTVSHPLQRFESKKLEQPLPRETCSPQLKQCFLQSSSLSWFTLVLSEPECEVQRSRGQSREVFFWVANLPCWLDSPEHRAWWCLTYRLLLPCIWLSHGHPMKLFLAWRPPGVGSPAQLFIVHDLGTVPTRSPSCPLADFWSPALCPSVTGRHSNCSKNKRTAGSWTIAKDLLRWL